VVFFVRVIFDMHPSVKKFRRDVVTRIASASFMCSCLVFESTVMGGNCQIVGDKLLELFDNFYL
jgi:hypothetical protein